MKRAPAPHLRARLERAWVSDLGWAVPQTRVPVCPELAKHDRNDNRREQNDRTTPNERCKQICHSEHLPSSEPEVLESLSGTAVEHCSTPLVPTLGCKISLGHPRGGPVRGGRQPRKSIL